MAVRKLLPRLAQPSLFDARRPSVRPHRRPYPWGPLEEARLQSEGVVPVEIDRHHRKDTAFVVRASEGWNVRSFLDSVETEVEVQTFEECGFPLLSLTVGVRSAFSAGPGSAPCRIAQRFGLLFDYEDEADRRMFEGLARQNRIWVHLVSARGQPLGQRDVGLTLWNRVQVYQALESAERIWARHRGRERSFVSARAHWEARQDQALEAAPREPPASPTDSTDSK